MASKSKSERMERAKQAYGTTIDMGRVLRGARLASGLTVDYISKCMGTSNREWIEYEQNHQPVPGHIIIKLMIFGMEFWARNRNAFKDMININPESNQKLSELCTLNSEH